LNLSESAQPPREEVLNSTSESETTPIVKSELLKYYIIGGAFQIKQNANKLVGTLRQNGYNATHEGINAKGLHLVSYFNSEDKSEALANLAMIRRDSNPSAWLLKK